MTFHQYSKEILTEYLGTVAYVDDLIFSKKVESKPVDLKIESTREMAAKTDKEMPLVDRNAEEEVVERKPNTPILQLVPNINPVTFTNAFLAKGIHCSLFEVENDEDSLEPLKSILKKSDVVILDWQMHQDDGRKARELLLSVIKNSQQPELRLYIIFTNDKKQYNNLLSQTILPELMKAGIINEIPENIECVFKFGHSKIVVLEKENGEKSETTVSDEELPDRIIEEFTEITSGLVSNTVLKAISVIRRNSHSLLATFNKDLDAAYYNHRAFLESPADSELHVTNWISDEIKDMLYFNNVSNEMNIDRINLSIDSYGILEFPIFDKDGVVAKRISKEQMVNLLGEGCVKYNKENEKNGLNVPQPWFKHFHKSFASNGINVNEKFATLSSLSSSSLAHDTHQLLTLGVIMKNGEDLLLCIQPSCDCLRLKKVTKFIFLKIEKSTGNVDLIIPIGETFEKLSLSYKSDNIVLIDFNPINGSITSLTENKIETFTDNDGKKYVWMGNLKYPFAQRIVNSFAYEISRVGLDESEWLRRS